MQNLMTQKAGPNRRTALGFVAAGVVAGALPRRSFGAKPVEMGELEAFTTQPPGGTTATELTPLNRFPRMMQDFIVPHVREAHDRAIAAKAAVSSADQARLYALQVRQKIEKALGPMPARGPLNPRIVGTLRRDGYRIEKVIFDSRPDFPITGNLYLPTDASGQFSGEPVVGMVCTCGHKGSGKAHDDYQRFAQSLARFGHASLLFDPVGQGERLQFPDPDGGSHVGGSVTEHLRAGNDQFLIGEVFAGWCTWDAMRAVDYLISRPEIDAKRIGITGNSGGGMVTTWMCGIDDRITLAAPSCFVSTFLRNCENELPVDTEQAPPHVLALGLEHEDFIAASAPKPIRLLAKEQDFFDIRGTEAAFDRLRTFYGQFGEDQADSITMFTGPTEHGYSIENREAMYRWIKALTGRGEETEPQIVIESEDDLRCTASGQVHLGQVQRPQIQGGQIQGGEEAAASIPVRTAATAMQLAKERPRLDDDQLRSAAARLLALPPNVASGDSVADPPGYRILRTLSGRQYPRRSQSTYVVETEPGAAAICYRLGDSRLQSRPPRGTPGNPAMLYVSHRSADYELREEKWLSRAIKDFGDGEVYTCDVRGIGESLPNTCGPKGFDDSYGCDYFYAIHGLMLDRPYLGQKVLDVLRVIDWLANHDQTPIELVGFGDGATIATFAAMFRPTVVKVRLRDPLESYESTIDDPDAADDGLPLSMILPNVLKEFDLPRCRKMLGDRLSGLTHPPMV